MMISLALSLTFAAGPAGAPSHPTRVPNESSRWLRGLDQPAATFALALAVPADVGPPGKVVRKCAAYASHAVLWTENPWLIGEQDVAGVTVSWWSAVDELPCLPRRGESACWRRILAARKVPPTVRIPQPDCEAIVTRTPSYAADPVGIQVTVHVRSTLGRTGLEHLGDAATCDEAP